MKPKWLLISYKSKTILSKLIKENVYILESGNNDKSVVEIFVFDISLQKEDLDAIRASLEGARFRDEGYIFYPEKQSEVIHSIFIDVYKNASIYRIDELGLSGAIKNKFEKISGLIKTSVDFENLVFKTYELGDNMSEQKIEESKAPQIINEMLFNSNQFLADYEKLSPEMKNKFINEIQDIYNSLSPSDDRIKGVFIRMEKITELLGISANFKKVLSAILDGVLQTFGSDPLAAAICGFDETRPIYYQFDHDTYIVNGKDKLQRSFMADPPRLGTKIINGKEYPGTASCVMEVQRYSYSHLRNIFIDDVKKEWPEWMPPLKNPDDPKLASTAYIPLIIGTRGSEITRVGIIIIQFSDPHKFTREEKQELNLYAKLAATVLYNVQLQKKLEIELNMTRQLQEMVIQMIHPEKEKLSTEEILNQAAEQLVNIAHDFYIVFYDPKTDLIQYQKLLRDGKEVEVFKYKPFLKESRNGLIEYILNTKRELDISSNLEEKAQSLGIDIDPLGRLPKSYLGVPIQANAEISGIVAIQNFEGENAFVNQSITLKILSLLIGESLSK